MRPVVSSCNGHAWSPLVNVFVVFVVLSAALPNTVLSIESPSDPKLQYKVNCNDDYMSVDIKKTDDIKHIYLNQMKFYPELACQPAYKKNHIQFKLSLLDVFKCGVTKVVNQGTGMVTYYHQIVIEKDGGRANEELKSLLNVKCWFSGNKNHTVAKRNVLPAGFQEPEDLEITTSLTKTAPVPVLKMGVRQGDHIVNGELNVNPGTPLQMEISLDNTSAPIYGLLVNYMYVTDTKAQEEIIIFKGCSLDPYLFENFNTDDGDSLKAKFRAFKFPESSYVQFKGTVNVCLDKCNGVDCSNGKVGFGRKRREISGNPPNTNKVFEVSMTTFIKVEYKNEMARDKVKLEIDSTDDQTNQTNSNALDTRPQNANIRGATVDGNDYMRMDTEEIREELKYILLKTNSGPYSREPYTVTIVVGAALLLFTVNLRI
ncbi:Zona pellucida domain [Cinara cedri]|uniref:Zona pellucida domain n=1 Tax=Cinara cedri TaxID=506608 RepID=A0A5E4NSP5_9HEMI|nr:Zona pellucida domain [Cinara cedri]